MLDYQRGKIYKIQCHKTGKQYIGSTTCRLLCQRLASHCESYLKHSTGTERRGSYTTSFEILKGGDYSISLLQSYPCSCKDELLQRERHYIERMDCVNRNVPGRTKQEYKRDKCAETRKKNEEYLQTAGAKAKQKKSKERYESSEKAIQGRAYRVKMKQEWGDRYCNSLQHICWDVFK